jgi:hypothetical protein
MRRNRYCWVRHVDNKLDSYRRTMKAVSAQAEQMIEEEKLANHTKEVEA